MSTSIRSGGHASCRTIGHQKVLVGQTIYSGAGGAGSVPPEGVTRRMIAEADAKLAAEYGSRPIPPSASGRAYEAAIREAARRVNNGGGSYKIF